MAKSGSNNIAPFLPHAYTLARRVLDGDARSWEVVTEVWDRIADYRHHIHRGLNFFSPRPKVQRLTELETFQCFLYEELEQAEREVEKVYPPLGSTFVLRYLKCIILRTFRPHPFYLAVAITGLLYNMTWSEIDKFYRTLSQGDDDTKGQKKKNDVLRRLKDDLSRRFGELLPFTVDGNDSITFTFCDDPADLFPLVQSHLESLVLWGREDLAGALLEKLEKDVMWTDGFPEIPELRASGRFTSESLMRAWSARKLSLISPQIFAKLAALNGLLDLASKIQIPIGGKDMNDPGDDNTPQQPQPTPEMYQQLFAEQRRRVKRRRALTTHRLKILVDGREHHFAAHESPRHRWDLRVPGNACFLKILAQDGQGTLPVGEFSLAFHRFEIDAARQLSFRCERAGAPPLEITVFPNTDAEGEIKHYYLSVVRRERRLWSFANRSPFGVSGWLRPMAVTFVALALMAGSWLVTKYNWHGASNTERSQDRPAHSPRSNEQGSLLSSKEFSKDDGRESPPSENATDDQGSDVTANNLTEPIKDDPSVVDLDRSHSLLSEVYGRKALADAVKSREDHGREYPRFNDLSFVPVRRMGHTAQDAPFAGCPNGAVIRTRRPTFRWDAVQLTGMEVIGYEIRIYESKTFAHVASSGPIRDTTWTPSPLTRGVTYSWELVVNPGNEAIKLPRDGIVKFRVLDKASEEVLLRAEAVRPTSHLILGDLYARAGLFSESRREFLREYKNNPNSRALRALLATITARQENRCGYQ